jgi:hypothetical protein
MIGIESILLLAGSEGTGAGAGAGGIGAMAKEVIVLDN